MSGEYFVVFLGAEDAIAVLVGRVEGLFQRPPLLSAERPVIQQRAGLGRLLVTLPQHACRVHFRSRVRILLKNVPALYEVLALALLVQLIHFSASSLYEPMYVSTM